MEFFAADIANADGAAADVIMAPWYHDAMTPWCHGGKAMAQRRHDATALWNRRTGCTSIPWWPVEATNKRTA